jgi:hypothetical protein
MTHGTSPANPARPMARRTEPALWTRLPLSGWQVRFWTDTNGHHLVDVIGPQGTLACRIASDLQAAPSIDAGWTRCAPCLGRDSQCWALAVGHAPAEQGNIVSFGPQTPTAARDRVSLPSQAPSGLWVTHNGLWAAAAIGCYAHVRLTARSATWLHPLRIVTD